MPGTLLRDRVRNVYIVERQFIAKSQREAAARRQRSVSTPETLLLAVMILRMHVRADRRDQSSEKSVPRPGRGIFRSIVIACHSVDLAEL